MVWAGNLIVPAQPGPVVEPYPVGWDPEPSSKVRFTATVPPSVPATAILDTRQVAQHLCRGVVGGSQRMSHHATAEREEFIAATSVAPEDAVTRFALWARAILALLQQRNEGSPPFGGLRHRRR